MLSLLNDRGYFPFRNYSVPKNDPIHNAPNDRALYQAIYNQIKPAHVILIAAGMYAHYSKWINHEINIAKNGFQNPKPIIAVKPWGNTNLPLIVRENADALVNWNTESIVAAIRKFG